MRKSEFQMLIFVRPVRRPSSLRHEFFFARKRVMVQGIKQCESARGPERGRAGRAK